MAFFAKCLVYIDKVGVGEMRSLYGFDSRCLCDTSRCDVATHVPPKNFRSMTATFWPAATRRRASAGPDFPR